VIGGVLSRFRDDRRDSLEDAVLDAFDPNKRETCAHIEYAGGMCLQFVDDAHDSQQIINVTGFGEFLSTPELIREVDRPVVNSKEDWFVVFEVDAPGVADAVTEIDRLAEIIGFRRRASTKIRCFRTGHAEEFQDMSVTEMIRTLMDSKRKPRPLGRGLSDRPGRTAAD